MSYYEALQEQLKSPDILPKVKEFIEFLCSILDKAETANEQQLMKIINDMIGVLNQYRHFESKENRKLAVQIFIEVLLFLRDICEKRKFDSHIKLIDSISFPLPEVSLLLTETYKISSSKVKTRKGATVV